MFYNAALKRTAVPDYDWPLVWAALALLLLGLVMVYSSSIAIAEQRSVEQANTFYLNRHGLYLSMALTLAYLVFRIPTRTWEHWAPVLFVLAGVALLLVLVPGIGKVVNGSRRWISLGPLGNFQPSELMKFATVIYAANYTVRKAAVMDSLRKGFMPMLTVMLVLGTLLQLEPDFGAFAVTIGIATGILFLGGLNWRLFAVLIILLFAGFGLLIWLEPFRLLRLVSYTNPWADPLGTGYQLTHALMAMGRGGWFGVGLGESVEKLSYLPEAHTDFLLAIVGEELGVFGVLVVLGLFAWIVWRGFSIGWQASLMGHNFQALAAQGVAIWLAAQAFINIGVNLGLLPTKGLTLPLMSYGGSGLVMNCLAIALLLRIDYENRAMMKGRRV